MFNAVPQNGARLAENNSALKPRDCSSIGKKEGKLRVGGKSDANKSAITPS
jgi:hypothetical protein